MDNERPAANRVEIGPRLWRWPEAVKAVCEALYTHSTPHVRSIDRQELEELAFQKIMNAGANRPAAVVSRMVIHSIDELIERQHIRELGGGKSLCLTQLGIMECTPTLYLTPEHYATGTRASAQIPAPQWRRATSIIRLVTMLAMPVVLYLAIQGAKVVFGTGD
jgi:hypothetical protein